MYDYGFFRVQIKKWEIKYFKMKIVSTLTILVSLGFSLGPG